MDAEFCVTKDGKDVVKFACTKSKDFGAGSDMNFTIKEVDLDGEMFYDADENKQITSVYLKYEGIAKKEKPLDKNPQKCLDSLVVALETLQKKGKGLTVLGEDKFVSSLEEWRPHAYDLLDGIKPDGAFKKGVEVLVSKGLVVKDGDYYWLP
jgi:hypothetical protein